MKKFLVLWRGADAFERSLLIFAAGSIIAMFLRGIAFLGKAFIG